MALTGAVALTGASLDSVFTAKLALYGRNVSAGSIRVIPLGISRLGTANVIDCITATTACVTTGKLELISHS